MIGTAFSLGRQIGGQTERLKQLEQAIKTADDTQKDSLRVYNQTLRTLAPTQKLATGRFADFDGAGEDRQVRTAFDEEFSLLSDSANFGASKVWYERVLYEQKPECSKGFMRISYELQMKKGIGKVPYVGVYADFRSPAKRHDISEFKNLVVKFRDEFRVVNGPDGGKIAPSEQEPPVRYYIGIADEVNPPTDIRERYAFAEKRLEGKENEKVKDIGGDWYRATIQLDAFEQPDYVTNAKYKLVKDKVYRLIISIKGTPNVEVIGRLDIDEISFEKE